MQIVHQKSITIADATGTVTFWNGTTTGTANATDLQRPTDWNSAHKLNLTATGNTTVQSTGSGTNMIFRGAGAVSLGFSNTNEIVVSAPAPLTYNYFNPQDGYLQVAGAQGAGTLHMQPMQAPNVTFDRLVLPLIFSNATNSTGSMTLSVSMGVFTRTGSTLSLLMSTSSSAAVTFSGTVGNSTFNGMRLLTIPWSSSIAEDQYYVGIWSRTTSGGANGSINQVLASQMNSNFSGHFGSNSNSSMQYTRGLGIYSVSFSTAMPNAVEFSLLRGTGSLALRQPVFYFANGTF